MVQTAEVISVTPEELLGSVLRDVSRSFYLTLWVLPREVRLPIGLAYLLARGADTLADTPLIPSTERLGQLLSLRKVIVNRERLARNQADLLFLQASKGVSGGSEAGERKLLELLPQCVEIFLQLSILDQELVAQVLVALIHGMELDLQRFPDANKLTALRQFDELEDYTFHVAGCVGPFWTKVCMAHLPEFREWKMDAMCDLGVRFGKALQWTNILRDIPRDLANGRCYLPSTDLAALGLRAGDLRLESNWPVVRDLYHRYLDHALDHYRAAWEYTRQIPYSARRLRLACIWPQWIGLETLSLLRTSPNPLNADHRIKISRASVYAIVTKSLLTLPFPSLLEGHQAQLIRMASSTKRG